jgi:hypothetical protein
VPNPSQLPLLNVLVNAGEVEGGIQFGQSCANAFSRVIASNIAHSAHAAVVEGIQLLPELLGQHPAIAAIEQNPSFLGSYIRTIVTDTYKQSESLGTG